MLVSAVPVLMFGIALVVARECRESDRLPGLHAYKTDAGYSEVRVTTPSGKREPLTVCCGAKVCVVCIVPDTAP
jgi:hypothetical protein